MVSVIVYENGSFYVSMTPTGRLEIYEIGEDATTRCAVFGEDDMAWAMDRCDELAAKGSS